VSDAAFVIGPGLHGAFLAAANRVLALPLPAVPPAYQRRVDAARAAYNLIDAGLAVPTRDGRAIDGDTFLLLASAGAAGLRLQQAPRWASQRARKGWPTRFEVKATNRYRTRTSSR
jgi:hypothetical protein